MSIIPVGTSVKFDKCPNCGSTERLIENEVNEEIKKGRMSKKSKAYSQRTSTLIFNTDDQKLLVISKRAPAIFGLFDVCAECGVLYCVEMHKEEAVIEPQMSGKQEFPPFAFGKG